MVEKRPVQCILREFEMNQDDVLVSMYRRFDYFEEELVITHRAK